MLRPAPDEPAVFQHIAKHGSHLILPLMFFYNIQFVGEMVIVCFNHFIGHGRKQYRILQQLFGIYNIK